MFICDFFLCGFFHMWIIISMSGNRFIDIFGMDDPDADDHL